MQNLDSSLQTQIACLLSLQDMASLSMTCRSWAFFFSTYEPFQTRVSLFRTMHAIQHLDREPWIFTREHSNTLTTINVNQMKKHCLSVLLSLPHQNDERWNAYHLERLIHIIDLLMRHSTKCLSGSKDTLFLSRNNEKTIDCAYIIRRILKAGHNISIFYWSNPNASLLKHQLFLHQEQVKLGDLLVDEAKFALFEKHWN